MRWGNPRIAIVKTLDPEIRRHDVGISSFRCESMQGIMAGKIMSRRKSGSQQAGFSVTIELILLRILASLGASLYDGD
jgi:hypothetical protein